MKMVAYRGVNHLALATRDMDRTIRFWRDLLGLRLVAGLGSKDYKHYFFALSERAMIAFFQWPEVEPIEIKDHGVPVRGPYGFDHVAIEVADDRDLWTLKDRLEAAGFWVSEVMDHGFIHSIYSFDPNNIAIEFCAPVAGVNLRNEPRMKDRRASAVAGEGAAPQPGHWPAVEHPTPTAERMIFPGEGTILTED